MAALPRLMAAAGGGYLTEQSEETLGDRTCLRLACDLPDDETTVYTTWFDQETLLPLRSEITADGEMVFEVAWNRFEVTSQAAPQDSTAAPPAEDGQPDASGQTAPADPAVPQEEPAQPAEDARAEADEAAAYASAEE